MTGIELKPMIIQFDCNNKIIFSELKEKIQHCVMVTLSLISTNSYNSLEAPEDRGISFLEVWMLGTHFPILFAITEYGIILSLDKSKMDLKNYERWDRRAQFVFFIYQIMFQGIYWMTASQHF